MGKIARRRYIASCASLFWLLGATPATGISVDDVTSISIHTSVAGLGSKRSSAALIERRNGFFTRDDGVAIAPQSVATLLEVLKRPPSGTFEFDRAGFDRAYLSASLSYVEGYLGDAGSMPHVVAAFETAYFDPAAFDRWFTPVFTPQKFWPVTDYSPELNVVLIAGKRRVAVSSRSQLPMMIPLTISEGRSEWRTYDPALPRALAALAPDEASKMLDLNGANVVRRWAYKVNNGPEVERVIEAEAVGARDARRLAESLGLQVDFRLNEQDDTYYKAVVWQRSRPLVQFQFDEERRSSGDVLYARLQRAAGAFTMLRGIHWIAEALAASPPTKFVLMDDPGGWVSMTVRTLAGSGRGTVATYLHQNAAEAVLLGMNGPQAWAAGRWWLLPNGDAILMGRDDGATPYPFGVIVHPDGNVSY